MTNLRVKNQVFSLVVSLKKFFSTRCLYTNTLQVAKMRQYGTKKAPFWELSNLLLVKRKMTYLESFFIHLQSSRKIEESIAK